MATESAGGAAIEGLRRTIRAVAWLLRASLIAAAALCEAGEDPPLVISIHGKGGGSRGSLPVFERLSRSDNGLHAVLYSHPAETGNGLADVKHIVQGVLDLTLTVQGWAGEPLEIGLPESALWSEGASGISSASFEPTRASRISSSKATISTPVLCAETRFAASSSPRSSNASESSEPRIRMTPPSGCSA